jgi:hypothetical protein
MAMAAATVIAFAGWLVEALAGDVHRVVPFIACLVLHGRGITTSPRRRSAGVRRPV